MKRRRTGTMTAASALLAALLLAGTALPGRAAAPGGGGRFLFAVRDAERGEPLVKPGGIAFDARRGEVVVTDRARRAILIFDEEGVFLQRIRSDRGFEIPLRPAIDGRGALVVGEQARPRLSILETAGRGAWGIDLDTPGAKFVPGGITAGAGDALLVVERFGPRLLRVMPGTGLVEPLASLDAEGAELQDVARTAEGRIVLVSSRGSAVYVLEADGTLVRRFGTHGSRPENFSFPAAVSIGPAGRVWVLDSFQHAVKVFTQEGTFLREFGEMGTEPGKLFFPVDLAFGRGGRLYILEEGVPRFQAFRMVGEGAP